MQFFPKVYSNIDYLLVFCAVICYMVLAALVLSGLYYLYLFIFTASRFGPPTNYQGEVVGMKYTPSKTTYNAATKTTSTESEKNEVFIKVNDKTIELDSDELYQRVRIGESVTLTSQAHWREPRFWDGPLTRYGYRLIKIECYKGQVVEFNDEVEVSSKVKYLKND